MNIRIEFYLFVSHSVMKDTVSMCKFSKRALSNTKLTRGPAVFHTTTRNKQVEFNP